MKERDPACCATGSEYLCASEVDDRESGDPRYSRKRVGGILCHVWQQPTVPSSWLNNYDFPQDRADCKQQSPVPPSSAVARGKTGDSTPTSTFSFSWRSHPTLGRERHTWTLEISLPALYVILLLHPFIHTGFIHVFIELIQKKKNTRSIHTGRSLGPTKHSKVLCLRVTGGLSFGHKKNGCPNLYSVNGGLLDIVHFGKYTQLDKIGTGILVAWSLMKKRCWTLDEKKNFSKLGNFWDEEGLSMNGCKGIKRKEIVREPRNSKWDRAG